MGNEIMDVRTADHFIWFYETLQDGLIKFLHYVAPYAASNDAKFDQNPTPNKEDKWSNAKTWPPHLARIIMDACGIIEGHFHG